MNSAREQEHQNNAPVVPRSAGEDGLRRIEGPAGTRGAARREEAGHQHQNGEQIDPITQHVYIGENHISSAHHQWDEVIAEAAEEQRREKVDHHDHAVHGDKLVVVARLDKRECIRETQLQPHHPGQHQCYQPDCGRRKGILDGDHFGVLAEYILRHPALRMVKLEPLRLLQVERSRLRRVRYQSSKYSSPGLTTSYCMRFRGSDAHFCETRHLLAGGQI